MHIIVIFFTFVFLIILCNNVVKWFLHYLKVRNLPSPPASPIFGHLHYFFQSYENTIELVKKIRKDFDKLVSIWFGSVHFVFVFDPEYVETICKFSNVTTKGTDYNIIRDIVGNSILTREGSDFHEKKKLVLKTLCTYNVLKMIDKFNENTDIVLKDLSLSLKDNQFTTIKMDKYVREFICRGLLTNVLGMPDNFNKDVLDKVIKLSKGNVKVLTERTKSPYLYFNFFFQFSKLHSFLDRNRKAFSELCYNWLENVRKNIHKNTDGKLPTIITSFLTSRDHLGKEYTDLQIRNEMASLMTAGLETTTYTIEKILLLLGKHKSVQNKVYEEICSVIGHSQRPITHKDVRMMSYLYQVLQETWRLFPPVTVIGRFFEEDIYLDKYLLPKGTNVIVPIKILNLDEKVFPNPEEFNPENFNPDKVKERHKFSFIPFFNGVRKCVGANYSTESTMIFIISLLRNFEISYDGEVEIEKRPYILVASNENYEISIRPRDRPLSQ